MNNISVIVPVYNMEKYLNKCLDSLVNQTMTNLEFIIVNDGSTDNSEAIIKTYHDDRIKYYFNENQGIGKTRNFGINKSCGKYLMFLDSDDYLAIDACEKLYEEAIKNDLDLLVFDFYRVYNNQLHEVKINSFPISNLKKNPDLLLDINLGPSNKLFKRDVIINNNIKFEEKLKYEDAPFIATVINKAIKIGKLDMYLHYYVIHNNSETTVRDNRVFDILKIVDKLRTIYQGENYIQNNLDTLTISILVNYNIQQRMQKDKTLAMRFIDESFKYMKKEVPDYRKNSYFKNKIFLKRLIEKNKIITKIYCQIYRIFS